MSHPNRREIRIVKTHNKKHVIAIVYFKKDKPYNWAFSDLTHLKTLTSIRDYYMQLRRALTIPVIKEQEIEDGYEETKGT